MTDIQAQNEAQTKAWAQWVHIFVQNAQGDATLQFNNLSTKWGRFYKWDNKEDDLSEDEIKKARLGKGATYSIAACGAKDGASGTEGSLDIYDGSSKVCKIYWDCPWGSKQNTFTVSDVNNNYIVQNTGANLYGGAIGTVTIKVVKLS